MGFGGGECWSREGVGVRRDEGGGQWEVVEVEVEVGVGRSDGGCVPSSLP